MVDIALSSVLGGDKPATSIPVMASYLSGGFRPDAILGSESASTTSASTQTPVDLTGSGVIEYVGLSCATALTASLLKITIDGVIVFNETGALTTNHILPCIGSSMGASATAVGGSLAKIPYKSSLKIEFASDGTQTATCYYRKYVT